MVLICLQWVLAGSPGFFRLLLEQSSSIPWIAMCSPWWVTQSSALAADSQLQQNQLLLLRRQTLPAALCASESDSGSAA